MFGDSSRKSWILLVLFIAQFLLLFRPGIMAWDGVFYYAYTRSSVCDGDLRLVNDLLLFYEARDDSYFEGEHFEEILTPTGRVDSPFTVGTSLLWLPWFLLLYGLMRLIGWAGLGSTTLTCYEWPFVWGMATVTCAYGWLSVLVGFRLARRFVNEWTALIASAVVMFTTPLLYYQFREPFYAHAASAMTIALFVAAWWRLSEREDESLSAACLLGALGGLAALVRSPNIAYFVLPVSTALLSARVALRNRDWRAVGHVFLRVLMMGLGGMLVLTLQFSVWYLFYGQPLIVPQGTMFMDWSAPWAKYVLFSSFHGLLPWLPLTVPAVVGLALSIRSLPRLSIPLLIAFLLQVYVNSCARDWFGGGGYGARRFSSALVILLVGYACLINWRKELWYRSLIVALGGLLILHQWLVLSYGLADSIGGYVVSMKPTYEWHADGIGHFVHQLVSYVPLAVQSPVRTLVLSDSPLEIVQSSFTSFGGQILLLAEVLVALYCLQGVYRLLIRRQAKLLTDRRFVLLCVMVLTMLADWWLLRWA
jgi:hypothetical protein